jgi:hypothetical protein
MIVVEAKMKIAKPMMIWMTPVGVAGGLYEGYELAGGLVFLMAALLAVMGAAVGGLVSTVRRERREADHG